MGKNMKQGTNIFTGLIKKPNLKFLFGEHPFRNWRGALGGFSNLEVKVQFDTKVSASSRHFIFNIRSVISSFFIQKVFSKDR